MASPVERRQSFMPPPLTNLQATFQNFGKEWMDLTTQINRARVSKAVIATSLIFMGITKLVTVPVLLQMMVYTLPIIWYGSHLSLNGRIQSQEDNQKSEAEVMSASDAAWFPVIASATIFGLYIAFKTLPEYWVNLALSTVVSMTGLWCVSETASGCLRLAYPEMSTEGPSFSFKKNRWLGIPFEVNIHLDFSVVSMIGYGIAIAICFGWLLTHAWILHNLFAIAFSVQAIRYLSLGNFKTGAGLLIALFFYDVFWVFGTDVMVSVAKNFNAPIKLLFPTSGRDSLLGLGDIVLPGSFIAMTLRFDYWLWTDRPDPPQVTKSVAPMFRKFPKFYFRTAMICYALSLLATGVIMLVFRAAQPALLYLVPAILLGLYLPALFRRQLGKVWTYSEEEEEEEEKEEEEIEESADEATTASLETRKDK